MGISGFILKKKEDTNIYQLLHDVKAAAEQAGLIPRIESVLYNSFGSGVYTTACIADTYEDIPEAQQWLMYIFYR